MRKSNEFLRLAGKVALWIAAIPATYVLIGIMLSLIPVNRNSVPGNDVTVYLVRNNVHADIVVPVRTDRIDWTTVVPPCDTQDKTAWEYLSFGWGSQDFYLNVPEWKDILRRVASIKAVIRALSGVGGTALHTDYVGKPDEGVGCRRITLSSAQYDALVEYILSSGRRNEAGAFIHIDHVGYWESDAFYEGNGRYSPFFTCNTWVNSALKACGQKCCLWTFLQHPIFWKYPPRNTMGNP